MIANLARHLDVDPKAALRHANAKFDRRFRQVEKSFDHELDQVSLDDMEAAWSSPKARES